MKLETKLARQRRKELQPLIESYNLTNMGNINDYLDTLKTELLKTVLEGEMDAHLGYEKSSHCEKDTSNRRNGTGRKKTVKTTNGVIKIATPRDRDGKFNSSILPTNSTVLENFETIAISAYAKGMSTRDIVLLIKDSYNVEFTKDQISCLINRVSNAVDIWRKRPLENFYVAIFIDCIYFSIREDLMVEKRAIYVVIGINAYGIKSVLGLWYNKEEKTESSSYWTIILEDLKSRGVKDILFICADGLSGYENAIDTVFPDSLYQRCMVHMIRNLLSIIPRKNWNEVLKDFQAIYKSTNMIEYKEAKENLYKKYENKKNIINKVEGFLPYIEQLMDLPEEIRSLIYTTNIVESVNSCLRKVTKNKGAFPNSDAVMKVLYLRVQDLEKKWTKPIKNWNKILLQLSNLYGKRFLQHLSL